MSLSISIRADVGKFETERFTKAMDKAMQDLFVGAAREFLINAVSRIKVRTGFLRGAFSTLEDAVGNFELTGAKPRTIVGKRKGKGVGSRPNQDLESIASKLLSARERQNRLLKRISKLRGREEARYLKNIQRQLDEQAKENSRDKTIKVSLQEKALDAQKKENRRNKVLRERQQRAKLLRSASINQAQINKLLDDFERKAKLTKTSKIGEKKRQLRLRVEIAKQKREQAFFRSFRALNDLRNGYVTTKFVGGKSVSGTYTFKKSKRRVKILAKIDEAEYKRRYKQLQTTFNSKNRRLVNLEKQLQDLTIEASKAINPKRLKKLKAQILKRIKRENKGKRLAGEKKNSRRRLNERSLAKELIKIINRKAQRKEAGNAIFSLIKKKKELQDLRRQTLQRPRLNLRDEEGNLRLNTVTRIKGGKIRGQQRSGKFDLREGEQATGNPFRLVEYYYPNLGRIGRVLKTPKSGRQFATAPSKIITVTKVNNPKNAQLFQQLASARRAAGLKVGKDVLKAAGALDSVPNQYTFNYSVNIRYLAINETREFWYAWTNATRAFNNYLVRNTLAKLPKLEDYTLVDQISLTNLTVRRPT